MEMKLGSLVTQQKNIINNSNFSGSHNALVETDNITFDTPIVIESNWSINTTASRIVTDNSGIDLDILNPDFETHR